MIKARNENKISKKVIFSGWLEERGPSVTILAFPQ